MSCAKRSRLSGRFNLLPVYVVIYGVLTMGLARLYPVSLARQDVFSYMTEVSLP
jgi:hypothetical protein